MEYTTIGEACTLHARIGWQGLTKSEYLDKGDYYLVTGVDFDNGHIAFDTCHFVTKERYDQDQHIQLQMKDVLVTKDGTIGKVAYIDRPIDKPATLNSGVFVVRPKDPTVLLPEYLMIMLMSNHFSRFIEQIKVGCTIAHLNQEKFLQYKFPFPKVDEQKHIIDVYYSAKKIINHRQLQLRILDSLIKARFVEMYKSSALSEETSIESIVKRVKVGFVGTCEKYYTDESGIPMLRTGNITDNGIDLTDLKYVTTEFHDNNPKSQIHAGDILIARHGSNGQANVYYGPAAQCLNAVIIVPNPELASPFFLANLINSPMVRSQIDRTLVGSTQHVVNTRSIAALTVRIPDLVTQHRFEDFVSQVDKSKAVLQAALVKTQLILDRLMQQYFG